MVENDLITSLLWLIIALCALLWLGIHTIQRIRDARQQKRARQAAQATAQKKAALEALYQTYDPLKAYKAKRLAQKAQDALIEERNARREAQDKAASRVGVTIPTSLLCECDGVTIGLHSTSEAVPLSDEKTQALDAFFATTPFFWWWAPNQQNPNAKRGVTVTVAHLATKPTPATTLTVTLLAHGGPLGMPVRFTASETLATWERVAALFSPPNTTYQQSLAAASLLKGQTRRASIRQAFDAAHHLLEAQRVYASHQSPSAEAQVLEHQDAFKRTLSAAHNDLAALLTTLTLQLQEPTSERQALTHLKRLQEERVSLTNLDAFALIAITPRSERETATRLLTLWRWEREVTSPSGGLFPCALENALLNRTPNEAALLASLQAAARSRLLAIDSFDILPTLKGWGFQRVDPSRPRGLL